MFFNEKPYWNEGAEAYRKGQDQLDNPYDVFDTHETEKANAWQHGYRTEKSFWDNQSPED